VRTVGQAVFTKHGRNYITAKKLKVTKLPFNERLYWWKRGVNYKQLNPANIRESIIRASVIDELKEKEGKTIMNNEMK